MVDLTKLKPGKYEGQVATAPDKPSIIFEGGAWREMTREEAIDYDATDVAKSAGIGLARGAADVAGAPVDILGLAQRGIHAAGDWATGYEPTPEDIKFRESTYGVIPFGEGQLPGSEDIKNAAYDVTGITYEPKTKIGKIAETAGEVVPAVLTGPGGLFRKGVQTVLTTGGIEGGGEAAAKIGGEKNRWIGELAGSVVGGTAGLTGLNKSSLRGIVADATEGVTPAQFRLAQQLVNESRALPGGGLRLTANEALDAVTQGATRLGDVMRFVEQTRRGSKITRPFYAGRPEEIEKTGNAAIDVIKPGSQTPSAVAPTVQKAAEAKLGETLDDINSQARTYYSKADPLNLPLSRFRPLAKDPVVKGEIRSLKSNRFFKEDFGKARPYNVGLLDQVRKNLGKRADAGPLATPEERMISRPAERTRDRIKTALSDFSPDYKKALQTEARLRKSVYDPLERGPTGQLAKADTFDAQRNIILPGNPEIGTSFELAKSLRSLKNKNPPAFKQLVSDSVRWVFNAAKRENMGVPNQWSGAKFNAMLRGNTEQGKALEATVRAVGGDDAWKGLQKVLDAMQATGFRHRPGATTAYNLELKKELEAAGVIGETVAKVTSPKSWFGLGEEIKKSWMYGRNTGRLADILTSPDGVKQLQRIAKMTKGTAKYQAAIGVLINTLNAGGGGTALNLGDTFKPGTGGDRVPIR